VAPPDKNPSTCFCLQIEPPLTKLVQAVSEMYGGAKFLYYHAGNKDG
jgi:hypothetical protein